ncbi:hypothetical protein CEP54_012855 [Fusarium duplospermum]|uniref:Mid2 domain-containing protein n=1 Tax=Fusarium duplospermum TaxID=1325734 RepID=A0A428P6D0_9HYPO|nr:hypothetical protein CEP54_012855 [Fusarium duplospermum]
MLFLYLLLWQVLSVGCLSSDTTTESEIVLFPFPSGSPIEAQSPTASVEPDSPWSSEIPFTKVWNDDQEGVEESTTGNFFGFISTISLAPQTSLEDTWSTKTLTDEDEVVFPTATLEDEDSETLSEPETARETKTGTAFEIPTLELPSVSSSLTGSGTSFTTLLRPTTTAEESSTPEPTRAVSAPSAPLSPGQIIGIVIGALASLVVVIVVILLLYRRRKHRVESRRPTIHLVGGPVPDPTERGSQIYLPVMHRQVVDSRDLLAGGVRRSGSLSRRSDQTVSELSPRE